MVVDCSGNNSEGFVIKIILDNRELSKLNRTSVLSVEIPASHTEYGTNTRIIIERNE